MTAYNGHRCRCETCTRANREYKRAWKEKGTVKPQTDEGCFCGAPDARDWAHRKGCPKMTPMSKGELYALALRVEAGWARAERIRR